ncbi:hypothetical protein [Methylobacterium nonmethylotrophicum]|uniref:hypothetical protein n=1 Tax=Methylobacterium nonmethylotrophicum TaxID=1141884 RepID=UPI00197C7DDD|nr:hypothetical protein [Methylobacterium nonmethylotrophicum]
MGNVVFNLWFEREYEDREDTELHIGIYSSEAAARAAIDRLSNKLGFRDYPAGFQIYPYTLDQDGWTDGFISITETDARAEGYSLYMKPENRHYPPIKPLP